MEDQKEIKKEESKSTDSGEGDKPKTNTRVDDTNLAAKRMEEATKASREERLIVEESYEKMKLGGGSEAGQAPKSQDELDTEEAEERVKAFQ